MSKDDPLQGYPDLQAEEARENGRDMFDALPDDDVRDALRQSKAARRDRPNHVVNISMRRDITAPGMPPDGPPIKVELWLSFPPGQVQEGIRLLADALTQANEYLSDMVDPPR